MEVSTTETRTEIVPVPFTLWSDSRQQLVRNAYQLLAIAWVLVLSIHSEETLYWAYLIGAIRGKDTGTWYKSPHFKIWVFVCLLCAGVMPGVANIETDDLTKMEDNIFLAGSISAFILFIGSIWLLIVFPRFIKESVSFLNRNPNPYEDWNDSREKFSDAKVLIKMYSPASSTLKNSTSSAPSSDSCTVSPSSPSPLTAARHPSTSTLTHSGLTCFTSAVFFPSLRPTLSRS